MCHICFRRVTLKKQKVTLPDEMINLTGCDRRQEVTELIQNELGKNRRPYTISATELPKWSTIAYSSNSEAFAQFLFSVVGSTEPMMLS